MAQKKIENPDEIVGIMAKPGETIRIGEKAYGSRATVQVRRGDLDRVDGAYEEVDLAALPDAASR
jgi:hypothetical protein